MLAAACEAQLVAVMGEHLLLATALPLWAYDRTHSARGVAMALAAVTLPALASLPAGAWAARRPPRSLLLKSAALRVALTLLLWGVVAITSLNVSPPAEWSVVLAGAFALSLVDSLFMPVLKAALPDWTPAEHLTRANALLEATDIPAYVLGPPLGVLLYARWGLTGAILAQAGAYGAAWLRLATARWPLWKEPETAGAFGFHLKEALTWAWRPPLVRGLLLSWTAGMVAGGIVEALVLPFLTQVLHQPESLFGLFGAALGAGMAAGAAATALWGEKDKEPRILTGATWLAAGAVAVFTHGDGVMIGAGALFVAGGAMVGIHVALQTLLQKRLPVSALAGLLGLTHSIQAAGLLVGFAVAGAVAPRWGLIRALDLATLLLAVAGGIAWSASHVEEPLSGVEK